MLSRLLQNWHRMFSIALTDLFTGTPWRVEAEKELAQKSQRLDIAIIERDPTFTETDQSSTVDLPDGLEDLRSHNLVTFKSHHEALDGFALHELIGHYVSYRKLLADPTSGRLPPEETFGLYAATVRWPQALHREVPLQPSDRAGVFDIAWGTRHIRIVVLSRIDPHPRNALWSFFGLETARTRMALEQYRFHDVDTKKLFINLFFRSTLEDRTVSLDFDQILRETQQEFLELITPEVAQMFLRNMTGEHMRFLLEVINDEQKREFMQRMTGEHMRLLLKGMTDEQKRECMQGMTGEHMRLLLEGMADEQKRLLFQAMAPEQRRLILDQLPATERLQGLELAELVRSLDAADLARSLTAEQRRALKDILDHSDAP